MKNKLNIQEIEIRIKQVNGEDYICITDMLKAKDGGFAIANWLRNRNTLEYIGIWERINNPNFKWVEFDLLTNKSGLNNFKISVDQFVEKTSAISLISKKGKGGGTYAHKDIAFEFGMWISAEFKIYLVKEFQRLKTEDQKQLEWSARRELSKINYHIHTDAIKENLIVPELTDRQKSIVYADEADLLNVALFGETSSEWRARNTNAKGNIRDHATISQLLVLANMESYNAILIQDKNTQEDRLVKLNEMARSQIQALIKVDNKLLLSDKDNDE